MQVATRPRHLILRLVTVYLLAFGAITLALGEGTYLFARHELDQSLDENLADRMAALTRIHRRAGLANLILVINRYREYGGHNISYRLLAPDGSVVADIPGLPRLAPGWGRHMFFDNDEKRFDPARTLTTRMTDGSMLTISADRDLVEHFDNATRTFIVSALGFLAIMAAAGGALLQKVTLQRIARLNDTARDILKGDLTRRVPVSSRNDEMDAVATTVNVLLDRMNALLKEMRRVSRYVAHDMRAPLVNLHDQLNELHSGKSAIDPEKLGPAVAICEKTIDLFSTILSLGDIDPSLIAETGELFDLSQLALDITEAYQPVAKDCDRELEASVQGDQWIFGDRDLLTQMLVNLIENGLVHTPIGATISVEVLGIPEGIEIGVRDNGYGISDDKRDRLLHDMTSTSASFPYREALGLRLVEAIVRAHRGTLDIQPNDPGTFVLITFPKNL